IALKPDAAEAYNNRGNVLQDLKRLDEALASYDRAIALNPKSAETYFYRGRALEHLKRLDEALASYDRAIALMPDFAEAHFYRGSVLGNLKRLDEALASYDRAIVLNPNSAEAYNNRGNVLQDLKRLDEALVSFDRAIALKPDAAEAYYNRGYVLQNQTRYDEAVTSYAKAIAIKPDLPYAFGFWLHSMMRCCDWKDLDAVCAKLAQAIDRGERISAPFPLLAISSGPARQLHSARILFHDKYPESSTPLWRGERYAHDRVRIGYFSSDFCDHPVSHLIAQLIESHDRAKFEIMGFSFGPPTGDVWRQRLEKAFDRFFDVRTWTDQKIAALAREQEIDIAVDLNGHTKSARIGIFALRPAPVQVNYLGYPGTLGADYMDYLIADHTVIPREHQQYYDEKIVYLPDCCQVNNPTKEISDHPFRRAELGLPDGAFVFCCFNNSYKITPDLFDIWMRLLHAVGGSVLWLSEANATAVRNLRREAEQRGMAPDRLVFAPRMTSLANHLARYRQADLFLDTFYYNAHTTASDALWAGLPVLTCLGETLAGRVAASLLQAIGLPELITRGHADYEALALALATQPERLAAIRQKLALNRTTQPLFDTPRFTRHIEAAYLKMHERYQAGLSPDHIVVDA
ncbi:MAG: tetratricopeptide repeat protein, partial [Sulfuricaulis sp.]|uniref:O-linked N-acetylglucosamine transferase, SPINDLY family protein n=1 Tax=Sulfuricaulis sp. TaxID=2003553 RepID=UPI003C56EF4B